MAQRRQLEEKHNLVRLTLHGPAWRVRTLPASMRSVLACVVTLVSVYVCVCVLAWGDVRLQCTVAQRTGRRRHGSTGT